MRPELTGAETATCALEIQSYAVHLGCQWIDTLRLPARAADPVGDICAIAAATEATAIIIPDLAHIGGLPDRIRTNFDLATVTPARLWLAGSAEPIVLQTFPLNDCGFEPTQLERDCARRLWEVHRDCFPDCLARLAASAALSASDEVD